jgi:CheY-like chemotaxis protein
MVAEGDRLTTLINDVLDIASLDAGTIRWNDQPYEMSLLVRRVVDELSAEAEKKGLPLRIEIEQDLPALEGDPRRIEQVMWNLLSNAIKFTQSGQVTITVRTLAAEDLIHKWRVPQGGGVLVSVADTGMGISEEEMSQLFQRFQQGGDALRNKPKGTGLGLAICREIVNHYQGEIWAESEVDEGTTFFFTLPISLNGDTSMEKEAQVCLPPHADAMSAPLVLIAENDPEVRQHLAKHLSEESGYRVVTLSIGSEVMERARQQCPAAIVLAIRLPRLSGVEVLRLLKSDLATVSIPVVMIASADHHTTCMRLGASAYLFKPVAADTLRETIERLL